MVDLTVGRDLSLRFRHWPIDAPLADRTAS